MTTTANNKRLRALYAAAIRDGLSSTKGRSFEEWDERVSDFGLEDARESLDAWVLELQVALATAFCAMQRSLDAGERQKQWLECLRLASELEKLDD